MFLRSTRVERSNSCFKPQCVGFYECSSKLTIDGTSDGEVWPDYKDNNSEYLLIKSAEPVVSKRPFADEYKFWSKLPLTSDFSGFRKQARSDKEEL